MPARTGSTLCWQHRFAELGPRFFSELPPQPLPAPYCVSSNLPLAQALGIDADWFASQQALEVLSGNQVAPGSRPLASVYSGHQFGVWAGQLGDGRALLLGELNGQEVQIKGAGRTPYSRMGDGRAVLRSSIREFLGSEAMHALGIPTTRALCLTGSDAPVYREELETAAVLTRTAPSFIRFGHFEHFSYSNQHAELKTLADFVIDQFYPECRSAKQPYAALLQAVSERTARLIAAWQAVGFCHGVMNTDNMSILGLTLDYGPFQFLDVFDPGHICNHSDAQGRYAYQQQPQIARWNLFCLGQALLPLTGNHELTLRALQSYANVFTKAYLEHMRAKLGLLDEHPEDHTLVQQTLQLLADNRVDYSIFWRRLCHFSEPGGQKEVRNLFIDRPAFDAWMLLYSERIKHTNQAPQVDLMLKVNPKYVLRNYLAEQTIAAAKDKNYAVLEALFAVLQTPHKEHAVHETWAGFPPDWAQSIAVSCSS